MTHDRSSYGAPAIDDVERLLRAGGRREAPDAIRRDAARTAVRDAWRAAQRARARRRWIAAGLPALAAAAALAIAVWPRPMPPPPVPRVVARIAAATGAVQLRQDALVRAIGAGDEIPAGAAVDTPPDGVATFNLPDGGELRQNGSTSVRWTAARQVALDRGQIYVDTGGVAGSAMAVETSAGLVRDIGTRFEVEVRGAHVRIRVRDGAVRLESPTTHREAGAGQALVIRPGAAIAQQPSPTFGADWDWILAGTPFRLEGSTIARFLAWIEVEGGRHVEFRPPQLREDVGAIVLHGSVQGLTMSEAIDTILSAAGLAYRVEGGRVIVDGRAEARR